MREIRTLRAMRRGLETGLRAPRQPPTLPGSGSSVVQDPDRVSDLQILRTPARLRVKSCFANNMWFLFS